MGNSAFQAAGSCLRPTLQLGGGRQTRVAPPGPALARSLQRGARYTTSCRTQRAGETRRRTGKLLYSARGKCRGEPRRRMAGQKGKHSAYSATEYWSLGQEGGAPWPAAGGEEGCLSRARAGRGPGRRLSGKLPLLIHHHHHHRLPFCTSIEFWLQGARRRQPVWAIKVRGANQLGFPRFPSALSSWGVPTPAKRKAKEKDPKLSRRSTSWRSLREGHPLPGHRTRCPHDSATARPPGHRTWRATESREHSPPPWAVGHSLCVSWNVLAFCEVSRSWREFTGCGHPQQLVVEEGGKPWRAAGRLSPEKPWELYSAPHREDWVWNGRASRTTLDRLQSQEKGSFWTLLTRSYLGDFLERRVTFH